jgi:hypothetical protein
MNPVEIEQDIRTLELMLYGGSPVRPTADFGREEMGHFDQVKVRAPEVFPVVSTEKTDVGMVIEQYVISNDGKMKVLPAPEVPEGG